MDLSQTTTVVQYLDSHLLVMHILGSCNTSFCREIVGSEISKV